MATLSTKLLFFTTSPRSPLKMIPEISILDEKFNDCKWNEETQEKFIEELSKSDFFYGVGSNKNKAFSARDRINRAPKSLGLVNLKPHIYITQPGKMLIEGKRVEETFLRQLLKFQLPSPYHKESNNIKNSFYIKPYLEIFRLINELDYLTFDELKIFGLQLIDYRFFDKIVMKIKKFRNTVKGKNYKKLSNEIFENEIKTIFANEISNGDIKTRESKEITIKKFVSTKKSNMRDYTDACIRYLRATNLVKISHRNFSISIDESKIDEVKYFLDTIDRQPVYIDNEEMYQKQLYDINLPKLFYDEPENLINSILRISNYSVNELIYKDINELKDIKEKIIINNKNTVINNQIKHLKSYGLYSEIIDTYNEIISDELYDAPLILEWNTWRAMTMLNGGNIVGNFKLDDSGEPLSTAPGNMADIVCYYDDYNLAVEVTMQSGQRQYETEGEPVARHYGKLKTSSGKNTYCLFIAPIINQSTIAHFYGLNKIDIQFYGGKSQIIPLTLETFMKMIEISYVHKDVPSSNDLQLLLDEFIKSVDEVNNELEWISLIDEKISNWLTV